MILAALSWELTDIFNCRFFLNRFPVCCNLLVALFLVTTCLVVAVQPCMELIPIKKKNNLKYLKKHFSFEGVGSLQIKVGQKIKIFHPPLQIFLKFTPLVSIIEEKNSKISAHNSNSLKSYGILKFGQKCLISSLHPPLWITTLYLFLNISSSTRAKWLKIGTWLFLRVLDSNLKRNWPAFNVLLVIFWF